MTNGHWEDRRKKEAQAKILYAQGKTQEADYLLGHHLHPGYIYVKDRVTEPEPKKNEIVVFHEDPYPEGELMSASETSTWYYVKKPSGTCVRTKLTPSSVEKAKGLGWIVSLTDICEQEHTPTPTPPSEPTPPILSEQIQKIMDDWYNHQLILPSWFANNNLNWVISGHITESEFLKGFNALLHEQIAYYVADHHPVEEPDVPEQMEFLCSDVYTLDNGSVVKTNYPTLSVPQIQNFINQGLMVRDCGTPSPTVSEVRSHYGYTADIEPEPEVPYKELHGDPPFPPSPTEEPEEPEQMQFLCSDVYTLDNGSVVKTSYPTLSVPQIQNFISQGLMVRDCGTPSPTVNEVRSHYGYTVEEPVGPEVTVPTEKFVVSKPGRLTMSDMTNTNAWVGILIAGTLAVPVFSSILSKRK